MITLKNINDTNELIKPRRIKKYIIIYISSGSLQIKIDNKDFTLKKHELITITSGQFHFITKNNKAKGIVLDFTYHFFIKDDSDVELIFQNGLFCHFDDNDVIKIPNYNFVENYFNEIENELTIQPFQYLTSIHSKLKLILIEINRARVAIGYEIWKPEALFLKFLEFVRANFDHNISLSEIAENLKTTELKLNELSKKFAGKTAQNIIYGLIISEAQRLLIYENLSIKETAFKLGFNDPFYFSNFFKKQTKFSPKTYQEKFHV
ncbi:MAG: helix-turn-helix domain-containing protein [Ignavibacteriales bacterium]|nr:helix-turn-helix domain-containing protein [Ignavibacteriales bacterium]